MDVERFRNSPVGSLTVLKGTDGRTGEEYSHFAYLPDPLPLEIELKSHTWAAVGRADMALGKLQQGSSLIPNPALLRRPTLRREAQSTSALEGTFAPIDDVIAADVLDDKPKSSALSEVMNYVDAAEHAFSSLKQEGISTRLLCEVHALLVRSTDADGPQTGRIRTVPVAIGSRTGTIYDARFVPTPPGILLESGVSDLLGWVRTQTADWDPVVAAAAAHYQFETLHPFNDGNGRIGRLLIVLQLLSQGVLTEPLLSVSPWFEARREEYQDALAEVSASGDWDQWVTFFAKGIESSANDTAERLHALLEVQDGYRNLLRENNVRGIARDIADVLIRDPYVTIPRLSKETGKTYQAVSNAVGKLVDLGVLEELEWGSPKIFRAPAVMRSTLRNSPSRST